MVSRAGIPGRRKRTFGAEFMRHKRAAAAEARAEAKAKSAREQEAAAARAGGRGAGGTRKVDAADGVGSAA